MKQRLESALRPRRVLVFGLLDAAAWIASLATFASLRFEVADLQMLWSGVLLVGVAAALLQLGAGRLVRLHHGRTALGSPEEMVLLSGVTGAVGIAVTILNMLTPTHPVPRSVPVAATFMTLALAAWGRWICRRVREVRVGGGSWHGSRRALILGAGDGGRQLIDEMRRDPTQAWWPVGLLDDDPVRRHRRHRGVQVLGTSDDLARVAQRTGCHTLIVAIPSASAAFIRTIQARANAIGVEVKVLPTVGELLDRRVAISDIRDIEIADLLGRRQIDTDMSSIAGYLTGRRVLVTGAGGSIGSELCRQVYRYAPSELIMLDRDESALHAVQLSLHGVAMLDSPDVVLADIRDAQRIKRIFAERRPDVVFHAAALKHLPMLEQYPGEAVKTNVWGTLAVLEAAKAAGVERFVNISTDKAANPCSVLGYSKRIAEGLTSAAALDADGTYVSVRFGNVLGSRGSMLASFAAQIASGGPLTVTHPEVTRYFMTVQEAVQLVIQAAAIGGDGEALVLDMGQPVRIADVAQHLVERSGRSIEVVFTGLRSGEKLHEELLGAGELDKRPRHPLVSHVPVPPVSQRSVREIDVSIEPAKIVSSLRTVAAGMCDSDVVPGLVRSRAALSSAAISG